MKESKSKRGQRHGKEIEYRTVYQLVLHVNISINNNNNNNERAIQQRERLKIYINVQKEQWEMSGIIEEIPSGNYRSTHTHTEADLEKGSKTSIGEQYLPYKVKSN